MKIFISWSGARSQALAKALHEWLPNVIQAIEPWMSAEDIQKGTRWSGEVGEKLSEINFGIICVTPENQAAPWLLFEAGALSKVIATAAVATILLDMVSSDLAGPLVQFQDTKLDAADVLRLVKTINRRLDVPLQDSKLDEAFKVWWPKLNDRITVAKATKDLPRHQRPDRELLEELLVRVRQQDRVVIAGPNFVRILEEYARATNSPPLGAASTFRIGTANVPRAEQLLPHISCPVHLRKFEVIRFDREDATEYHLGGCCGFSLSIAYEYVKDLIV